jgi:hypothetical protein
LPLVLAKCGMYFCNGIAVCLVAENQLAHKLNLFMRNLVQGIDFGAVDDGHIEIMNRPRISSQAK